MHSASGGVSRSRHRGTLSTEAREGREPGMEWRARALARGVNRGKS